MINLLPGFTFQHGNPPIHMPLHAFYDPNDNIPINELTSNIIITGYLLDLNPRVINALMNNNQYMENICSTLSSRQIELFRNQIHHAITIPTVLHVNGRVMNLELNQNQTIFRRLRNFIRPIQLPFLLLCLLGLVDRLLVIVIENYIGAITNRNQMREPMRRFRGNEQNVRLEIENRRNYLLRRDMHGRLVLTLLIHLQNR
jgi:hypothetical protein